MIEIDLRDNPDNLKCGLNLTEATSQSGAMTGVFNSIDHTVPPNAGSFRRVRVHLREGCIVGIPKHPYSCSMGTSNFCDRISNAVAHAIADLGEGFGMAECGPLLPPATGVISGRDPRSGEDYVNEIFLAHTAAGASPSADGWLTLTSVGSAGLCLLDSVELDELRFPMRVYKQEIAVDTEGAGRRRGAPGAHVEFGPVDCEMMVAYASDGTMFPAKGARGGGDASRARQIKARRERQRGRAGSLHGGASRPGRSDHLHHPAGRRLRSARGTRARASRPRRRRRLDQRYAGAAGLQGGRRRAWPGRFARRPPHCAAPLERIRRAQRGGAGSSLLLHAKWCRQVRHRGRRLDIEFSRPAMTRVSGRTDARSLAIAEPASSIPNRFGCRYPNAAFTSVVETTRGRDPRRSRRAGHGRRSSEGFPGRRLPDTLGPPPESERFPRRRLRDPLELRLGIQPA